MSVAAIRTRLGTVPAGVLEQPVGLAALVAGLGALVGWLVIDGNPLFVAALCLGFAILVAVWAVWGLQGFVLAILVVSMFPVPAIALGTAAFPFATGGVVLILAAALVAARMRGVSARVPYLWPYLALIAVGVISLAASWIFWDPRVATGTERGYGHRWIAYQVTGLFLLAFPLLAFAGGVLCSRLLRIRWLYAGVFLGLVILTLLGLGHWFVHPSNPIDAFANGTRTVYDYQWAAMLVVTSLALVMWTTDRRLRRIGIAMFVLAAGVTGIEYVLSAWIAILVAITVMVWYRYGARGLLLWLGLVALVGLLAESTIATIILQRSLSDDSDRIKLWESAITVWGKGPVIGVGPSNLASYMETYSSFSLNLVIQGYQQAHNIFLEVLAEEGIIGLVLLGVFVFFVTRALLRFRSGSSTDSFVVTAALGVIVATAIISAFGGGFVPTIASAGYTALPKVLIEWFLVGCGIEVARRAGAQAAR